MIESSRAPTPISEAECKQCGEFSKSVERYKRNFHQGTGFGCNDHLSQTLAVGRLNAPFQTEGPAVAEQLAPSTAGDAGMVIDLLHK